MNLLENYKQSLKELLAHCGIEDYFHCDFEVNDFSKQKWIVKDDILYLKINDCYTQFVKCERYHSLPVIIKGQKDLLYKGKEFSMIFSTVSDSRVCFVLTNKLNEVF
jgi:hypothetical protein